MFVIDKRLLLLGEIWGLFGWPCGQLLIPWRLKQSWVWFHKLGCFLDFSADRRRTVRTLSRLLSRLRPWLRSYWRFTLVNLLVCLRLFPLNLDRCRSTRTTFQSGRFLRFESWDFCRFNLLTLLLNCHVFRFSPCFVALIHRQILCDLVDNRSSVLGQLLVLCYQRFDLSVYFFNKFCHFLLWNHIRRLWPLLERLSWVRLS